MVPFVFVGGFFFVRLSSPTTHHPSVTVPEAVDSDGHGHHERRPAPGTPFSTTPMHP
jgi:hypothetical protein